MAVIWKIENCDRQLKSDSGDDLITSLHWRASDSETVDGVVHTGSSYGCVGTPVPTGSFIAYKDVTEANCIAWAKSSLGADAVKNIEDGIANQIAVSKAPLTGTGNPW
tara:strand:+ start:626 stop:949 length:324 start_codon:yes stop_codon:yes gene_type:complete